MTERHDTIVIGGGQAGLAMSYYLQQQHREHVVIERGRIAERWRSERWDSLHFQFPNWALQLPGHYYNGSDPDGFAHYSEVIRYIESYAKAIAAPLRLGAEVMSLTRDSNTGRYVIATNRSMLAASRVVIATGPFQRPSIPPLATTLPPDIVQLHSSRYRNSEQIPTGAALIVGSGGSGCQIAEELNQQGRKVFLTVNRHRRVPRRYRGRDALSWLAALGRFDVTIDSFPEHKPPPTVLVTGVNGGHDIDLRRFASNGVVLLGKLCSCRDGELGFDVNLEADLAWGDETFKDFRRSVDEYISNAGIAAPEEEEASAVPSSKTMTSIRSLSLASAGIKTIIWCTGYRFDFDWLRLPVLDERGAPIQHRGVTNCSGAYFLGLHWMHKFKSGTLFGIDEDAAFIAEHMATRA